MRVFMTGARLPYPPLRFFRRTVGGLLTRILRVRTSSYSRLEHDDARFWGCKSRLVMKSPCPCREHRSTAQGAIPWFPITSLRSGRRRHATHPRSIRITISPKDPVTVRDCSVCPPFVCRRRADARARTFYGAGRVQSINAKRSNASSAVRLDIPSSCHGSLDESGGPSNGPRRSR